MLHTAHPHECRWQCWDCLYGQYRAATQEYLMYSPSKGFAESVIAEYFPYTTFLRLLSLDYFPYSTFLTVLSLDYFHYSTFLTVLSLDYFHYSTFLRLLSLDYFPYMPAEYSMLSKSQAQMYQNTLTNP